MDYGRANLAFAGALLESAAQRGLRHVVICPGSRSTPLALAAATHPSLTTYVLIDERSAGYFALGIARQLREPVALICTSGTAAANFAPAVIEAYLSRISLLVFTADRPAELRDWGASQTIDQDELFGSHVRWSVDLPAPVGDEMEAHLGRATVNRAMHVSGGVPAGPVHLNVQFREPLIPAEVDPLMLLREQYAGQLPDPSPTMQPMAPAQQDVQRLVSVIRENPRGIVVCGPHAGADLGSSVAALSQASGYPTLADPLSSVRFNWPFSCGLVDAYDLFLRDPDCTARLSPNLILRVGGMPTSKPLTQFMARQTAHVVAIDPGGPRDASHAVWWHLAADESATVSALASALESCGIPAATDWTRCWQDLNSRTRQAVTAQLARDSALSEPAIAASLLDQMPAGSTLVVGNSMPVRDIDTFTSGGHRGIYVTGTRGASGIDGVVSTAVGAAAVANGPVVLLVGDLSFLHDLGGLQPASLARVPLVIIVVNNNGGGIFSFLPQATQVEIDTFERLFGTPANVDIEGAARMFRCAFAKPTSLDLLWDAVRNGLATPGVTIVEARTNRAENLAAHRAIAAAVVAELASVPVA